MMPLREACDPVALGGLLVDHEVRSEAFAVVTGGRAVAANCDGGKTVLHDSSGPRRMPPKSPAPPASPAGIGELVDLYGADACERCCTCGCRWRGESEGREGEGEAEQPRNDAVFGATGQCWTC